jgi:hypothetical protein
MFSHNLLEPDLDPNLVVKVPEPIAMTSSGTGSAILLPEKLTGGHKKHQLIMLYCYYAGLQGPRPINTVAYNG